MKTFFSDQKSRRFNRADRYDFSLFQLGLYLLEHFLDEYLPIPMALQMPALAESVR